MRVPESSRPSPGSTRSRRRPPRFATGLDLVISLGGDGTMLHAVELVYPAPVPILGVNVGMLGYLTEVEPDELESGCPRLLAGRFEVSERMMLAVDVDVGRRRRAARGSRSTRRWSRSCAPAI